MITAVTNYKNVCKYIQDNKLNPSQSQLTSVPWLTKGLHLSKTVAEDFVEVQLNPRLIEIDQVFEDYADCKISNNKMQTIISNEEYHAYNSIIRHCQERRSAKTVVNRQMQVIWITGSSGSGKTTLAKYFADKLGYEAYVTSNSDNLFDSYDLQPAIIVDEFRSSLMKFSAFLQMTDNHTNKKQAARYHDVDLSQCKLMIITSIYAPEDAYRLFKAEDGSTNQEPMEQLLRRLKHRYYRIEDGKVKLVDTNSVVGVDVISMNTVFDYLGIDPNKVDEEDLLSQFYEEIPEVKSEVKPEVNFNKSSENPWLGW